MAKELYVIMEYVPSERELSQVLQSRATSKEVKEVLSGTPLNMRNPIPISSEEQARKYLSKKICRYCTCKSVEVGVDRYISQAMNTLLTTGFTYANLYSCSRSFLTEPHVASALAFNRLNHILNVPDSIDLEFGLNYEVEA